MRKSKACKGVRFISLDYEVKSHLAVWQKKSRLDTDYQLVNILYFLWIRIHSMKSIASVSWFGILHLC